MQQGESEEEEEGHKQNRRRMEDRELCTLQERVGSLRTHLEMKEMNEDEWEDERGHATIWRRNGYMITLMYLRRTWISTTT